jgi:hypothetical protein
MSLCWVKMLELLLRETSHMSELKRVSATPELLRFESEKVLVESPLQTPHEARHSHYDSQALGAGLYG